MIIVYTGIHIQINESIQLIEGRMKETCLLVVDEKVREREIAVYIAIMLNSVSITSGTFIFFTMTKKPTNLIFL